MRHLLMIAPVMLIAAAPADPHDAIMAAIESKIVLPDRAQPLDHYARYYSTLGDGTVIAIYVALGDDRPGRQWVTVDKLPRISDGGCGVVTVFYDPKDQRVTRVMCNMEI